MHHAFVDALFNHWHYLVLTLCLRSDNDSITREDILIMLQCLQMVHVLLCFDLDGSKVVFLASSFAYLEMLNTINAFQLHNFVITTNNMEFYCRVPIIGGKELDLHRLFVEVTSRGGIEKVRRDYNFDFR